MKFKTLALLALAGVATRLYMKQRGNPLAAGRLDGAGSRETDAWRPADRPLDSPNPAERLRDEALTGSPIGAGSRTAASGLGEDLFSSNSRRGEEPVAPGLPDLTRGA
jgi:hypothetical protein